MRALKAICGAAALVAFLAPGARADEWNKLTYLTFSGPVSIPGATLPAGTYTFQIADPNMARHVIRVTEKDTNKPVGLFMTIPRERLEPPDENLIMFAERPAGSPQAIQVWFYPGDRIGEEFVYPKSQAVSIAKANHTTVLATEDETNQNASEADRIAAMKNAPVGRVDENGQMKPEQTQTSTSTTTTTTEAQSTPGTTAAPANTATGSRQSRAATTTEANASTAPSSKAARSTTASRAVGTAGQTAQTAPRQLPRTASNLVTFELLSGIAFAGALAARKLRRLSESKQPSE